MGKRVARDASLAETTVQAAAAAQRVRQVRAVTVRAARSRNGGIQTMTPDPQVVAAARPMADGDLHRVQWLAEDRAVVWNSRRQRRQPPGGAS